MHKTLRISSSATALLVAAQGCGLVRGAVNLVELVVGVAFDVALNGGINAAILVLGVLYGGLDYDHQYLDVSGARVGHLDCSSCEGGEDTYVAAGEEVTVVPEAGWSVSEFGGEATAFNANFDTAGDTELTWTDGERDVTQRVFVRDAVDVAVLDLDLGGELTRLDLKVGETRSLEILPVDAEGHLLAANYEHASVADTELATTVRGGLHTYEADALTGTIVQVTGNLEGETTLTVRVAGLDRTLPVTITP